MCRYPNPIAIYSTSDDINGRISSDVVTVIAPNVLVLETIIMALTNDPTPEATSNIKLIKEDRTFDSLAISLATVYQIKPPHRLPETEFSS